MPKVKKTYRIDAALLDGLDKLAKERGMGQTEAVEAAIRDAIRMSDTCQTHETGEGGTDWEALYFAEKARGDEMSARLLALTDKVADSLQAAQTLQAMDKPALESSGQKAERASRWQRLKEAWRG